MIKLCEQLPYVISVSYQEVSADQHAVRRKKERKRRRKDESEEDEGDKQDRGKGQQLGGNGFGDAVITTW